MKGGVVFLLLVASLTGCTSRLSVKKVLEGPTGDQVKGFRYHLSRPYVVVQKPILVSEQIRVGQFKPGEGKSPPGARGQAGGTGSAVVELRSPRVRELDTRELESLKHHVEASSDVRRVSHAVDEAEDKAAQKVLETNSAFDATVPSDVGTHQPIPTDTHTQKTDKNRLQGNIKVIFLPDLDETYAVQDCSIMAKSAYKLSFRDGWELTDVSGEFDSTTVAVELLTVLDNAINKAQSIEEARIERQKAIADAAAQAEEKKKQNNLLDNREAARPNYFQEITRTYIKPGVYRINKPWEIEGGLQAHQGSDLLSSLGLTLCQVTERQILYAEEVDITTLGKAKTGEVGR